MKDYIGDVEKGRALPPNVVTYTASEMMMIGLNLVYSSKRINRVHGDAETSKTNIQHFKDHFGANPSVAAMIWSNLQTTASEWARMRVLKLDAYLELLNFLYRYHHECEREAEFDKSPKTIQKWTWYYLMKIQALKDEKIVFPDVEEFGDDVIVLSVDGTHCLWEEPIHPEFLQDKKAFSHKKKHAGLGYKLGIHLEKMTSLSLYAKED